MPDNRELAVLIWLTVALFWVLSRDQIHSGLGNLLRQLFNPVIFLPLLLMFAYVWLETRLGLRVRLWNADLAKGTIVWAGLSATVLYFSSTSAASDPQFFRRTVAATLGVAVFDEFFMNLYVIHLWAELVLQPVVGVLALLVAVAGTRTQHGSVKTVLESVLAVRGHTGQRKGCSPSPPCTRHMAACRTGAVQ